MKKFRVSKDKIVNKDLQVAGSNSGVGSVSQFLYKFGISTELINPYKQYSWSYACIKIISTACSGVPLKLYKTSDNTLVSEEQKNPWYQLLMRPNPLMVGTQFWKLASIYYESFGQAFIVPRDEDFSSAVEKGQMPKTLELIDPRRIEPVISATGVFSGWEYNRGGSIKETLNIHQVIRFFEPDTDNILKAMAPHVPARTTILSDIKAHKYNEKFFENGGQIQGVLVAKGEQFEDLTQEEIDEIRGDWDSRFSGEQGAHRTPVLSNGLEYLRTGASQKDMDFKDLMVLLREEVLADYGVPKTKLGLTDKVDRAVAKVFDRQFYQDNILPKLRDWASILNGTLLNGSGYYVEFDSSVIEALNEDSEVRVDNAEKLHRLGYSLNQVNESMDLGMEEINDNWAKQPVDTRNQSSEQETKGKKGSSDEASEKGKSYSEKRSIGDLSDEEFSQSYIEQVLENKNTEKFNTSISLYFTALERDQIARLEEMKDFRNLTKASTDDFLFDSEEWDKKLMADAEGYINTAFKDSTDFLEEEIGGFTSFVPGEDQALRAEMERKLMRITGINETVRKAVRASIVEGLKNAETVQQITERVRDTFEVARARALTIARTEVSQSAGASRHVAMTREGLKKRWVTANDDAVRDSHKLFGSIDAKPMTFEYAPGLKYPGDMDCSDGAEVINCRCITRAVRA